MSKIIRNTLILTIITVVAGLGLGLVYEVTKEPIARTEEQAKKERAITRKTGSLDEESLREIMYDAVERVNFVDGQNIEIVWKFDDLFATA